MRTIKIEVEKNANAAFFVELLKQFDYFISEEELLSFKKKKKYTKKDLPVVWAKKDADIMKLAGIWKGRKITLEQIRKKAWQRK